LANSLKTQSGKKFKLSKPFFLFVGSRKRYKNFTLLLKSYSLDEKIKKNFDIVCFGGGKFIREEINNIKDLKVDLSSIHQVEGSDEILSSLYSSAEALIYPSKYEGFGLPILEAMSLGCPVISSNTSSLPEVYGDAALNFTPTSSDELLNCITKITNNNELKEAYIKKGYNREKNFSWKKCAVETNKIYQKLI
jgi:glycosyltransferase involved in cell wall biosynthesis